MANVASGVCRIRVILFKTVFYCPYDQATKGKSSCFRTQERRKEGTLREKDPRGPSRESHDHGQDILAQLFTMSLDVLDTKDVIFK